MDEFPGTLLQHALLQELEWMKAREGEGPAHVHALNLQGMLFRLRMSHDLAFYAEAWRRICNNATVWRHVEVLVKDAFADWTAGRMGVTEGLRDPSPTKLEERVRNDYYARFYQVKEEYPADKRRRTSAVALTKDAPTLPDGFQLGSGPLANPQRRLWFWALIQLCPETMVASRRVTEAWTRAAGIRFNSRVYYAEDPDENRYFVALSQLMISRVVPMRWFTMIQQDQRDALLARPSKCRMPVAAWEEWRDAVASLEDPDRPMGVIIDEAARALVDSGHPAQALRLLDSYLPHLRDSGQDVAPLYHDLFLAYNDLDKPRLALKAAQNLQDAAARDKDGNLVFMAGLCTLEINLRLSDDRRATFQHHWVKLLPQAQQAAAPQDRVWRLTCLSAECDRAGQRKEAEKALLVAQEAAAGNAHLLQIVLEHDRMRDALGGTIHNETPPPLQRGLLGTKGFQDAAYHALVERYYQSYPEERPS